MQKHNILPQNLNNGDQRQPKNLKAGQRNKETFQHS